MFVRPPYARVYLFRIAVLLTVLTGLFGTGFFPFTLDNSRQAAASPFVLCIAPCFENFDNVTAPALPTGWTATLTAGQPADQPWRTVNTVFDPNPSSVFAADPNHVTDNQLTSRHIGISSSAAVLTFRRNNNLEESFDGMVLEISIDGGGFQDIISAGGSWVAGGYNGTIADDFENPLGGRAAWTGNSGGFVITSVKLPNSADGRTVRFRWRVGTDHSVGGPGAFIDTIDLTHFSEPPANDNFANAQPILGTSGVINGSNLGATREPNEPKHAGIEGTGSVWFRWQAPNSGKFAFTTFGSASRTLLAVYTGTSLPGVLVASNAEDEIACFGPPNYSGLSFDAVGGTTYHIAVDNRSSNSGNVRLRWGRSATISGRVTNASMVPTSADRVELSLDGSCYRRSESGGVTFTNVPTGGDYSVNVLGNFSSLFSPYPGNPSISPLTGSVSNLNFYRSTPAHSVSGTVTIPGGDTSGLSVTCVSTPGALVTRTAANLGDGKYQCAALPTTATYLITPTKLGFTFTPPTRTEVVLQDLFFVNFTGAAAPSRTISGRVTNSAGTGISNVAMALSGSQTASSTTNATGNYSFTVLHGGNYTIAATSPSLTFAPPTQGFTNVTTDQTANFTGTFLLQLILDDAGQVAALNSSLLTRDPFPVVDNTNVFNSGVNRNTRVSIFLANFQLGPGESASSVVVSLIDSNNQNFESPAEAVRSLSDPTFAQVTFRLPDALTPGNCTVAVKARGMTSNMGVIKIK